MGRESNFSAVAPSLEGRQLSNVDSSYGDLSGGFGSLGNNRIGLRGPSASSKSYCSTNQSTEEKKTRKSEAKACLFAALSQMIFMRIMSLKTAKELWDYLKVEYEGDERIRGMKVLNLIRDFELQKMKDLSQ